MSTALRPCVVRAWSFADWWPMLRRELRVEVTECAVENESRHGRVELVDDFDARDTQAGIVSGFQPSDEP